MVGSVLYIGMIWLLNYKISFARNLFPQSPLTIECFHNISTTFVTRCPLNATATNHCVYGVFANAEQQYFTICPDYYGKWYFLWMISWVATGLLGMSLFSISYLYYLIDPVRRMMEGKRFGINTWPEKDAIIKPFILKIMRGEEFAYVNEEANDVTKKSLLELSAQSRLLHFTKVYMKSLIKKCYCNYVLLF